MSHADSTFAALNPVAYLDGSIAVHRTVSPRSMRSANAAREARIVATDRAIRAVTDFTWEQPVTIAADRTIK